MRRPPKFATEPYCRYLLKRGPPRSKPQSALTSLSSLKHLDPKRPIALHSGISQGGYPNAVCKYARKAIDGLCSGAELCGRLPKFSAPSGGWRQDAQLAFRTLMHPLECALKVKNVFSMRLQQ
jgi:hypothetical protein